MSKGNEDKYLQIGIVTNKGITSFYLHNQRDEYFVVSGNILTFYVQTVKEAAKTNLSVVFGDELSELGISPLFEKCEQLLYSSIQLLNDAANYS